MDPSYSDKIIHIYSIGRIGNGSNLACVYCKQKGHIKSKCPVAKKENLGFTFNFLVNLIYLLFSKFHMLFYFLRANFTITITI